MNFLWSQINHRVEKVENYVECVVWSHHLGNLDILLTLFVSPVKMIPLASRRMSPVVRGDEKLFYFLHFTQWKSSLLPDWSWPVIQAAWCGNKRLIRIRPGYGADESIPPDTDRPSPPGPFTISTLNVQSEK
jgi:hypothetical protein